MTDYQQAASPEFEAEQHAGETRIYLYGIGLVRSPSEAQAARDAAERTGIGIRLVDDFAAFFREAPASEFPEEALNADTLDQEWLMRQVQHHHQIVADLSRQLPLLPATFGTMYATGDPLVASLETDAASLRERLERIAGCDEWALHVYRAEDGIRERVVAGDPELRRMSDELEGATPGRAYLLRQQLEKRISRAIEEQQLSIADSLLDEIRPFVRDIQIEEPRSPDQAGHGEVEIAHASLLVLRGQAESMLDKLSEVAGSAPGIHVEVSGPWPVYSFTRSESGRDDDRTDDI